MAIAIRPALPDDAGAIARIFLQSAEHHARIDPEQYSIPPIDVIPTRHRDVTLVAELNNEIAGFVDVRLGRSTDPMHREMLYCHIVEIAVDAAHRSEGIGAQLMHAAEDWGRRHGASLASLEYNAANPRAAAFYNRSGYRTASITAIKNL